MVALDQFKYKAKFKHLVQCGIYELLYKDPTTMIESKVQELLFRH
jgi:hypothetical protein